MPAYNEAHVILATVREASEYITRRCRPYEIIVAADGEDGTRDLVADRAKSDPALLVIGSAGHRGKGHGVRQGVALARGEIIGFVDADNKTPIDEFAEVEPLLREGYDLVNGSRGLGGATIKRPQPPCRRVGARVFDILVHATVGLREIIDTKCGFKFFRRDVAHDLFNRQRIDGYMFDVEVLFLAQRAGYRIAQVPIRWRDDGDSRLTLKEVVRDLIDLSRIRLVHHHYWKIRPQAARLRLHDAQRPPAATGPQCARARDRTS